MLDRLKQKIASLRPTGEVFTADETAHADASMATRDLMLAQTSIKTGTLFNIVGVLYFWRMGHEDFRPWGMGTMFALFCIDIVWLKFVQRKHEDKAWYLVLFGNFLLMALCSWVLHLTSLSKQEGAFVVGTSAGIVLSAGMLILSPFSNWKTPAMAAGYFIVMVALFPQRPESKRWLTIYSCVLLFSCIIRASEAKRLRREAILEFRKREFEIRAARMRFERELELAREIQDSLAPPERSTTPEGLVIHCLHMKHEKVGGDWTSIRNCDDGSTVLVIADASGKGVQAALVIHAIQSLWATTLDQPTFDPKAWLELVNHALFRLGEKQTHSATAGLAIIKGNRFTYWSAGHLPAFLLLGPDDRRMYRPLISRGDMLGVSSHIHLSPQFIDIAPGYPIRIIMGSDGVLPKGTLTQQKDIELIYDTMCAEGVASLEKYDTGDDKTLIVVEKHLAQPSRFLPAAS